MELDLGDPTVVLRADVVDDPREFYDVLRAEAPVWQTLEQLLARTSSIALDPDRPPTRRPSIFLRRHAGLPTVLTRA